MVITGGGYGATFLELEKHRKERKKKEQ